MLTTDQRADSPLAHSLTLGCSVHGGQRVLGWGRSQSWGRQGKCLVTVTLLNWLTSCLQTSREEGTQHRLPTVSSARGALWQETGVAGEKVPQPSALLGSRAAVPTLLHGNPEKQQPSLSLGHSSVSHPPAERGKRLPTWAAPESPSS